MNPLDVLTYWDFVLLILGVFFRFLQTMRVKTRQFSRFSMRAYFNVQHLFRWLFHLITSLSLLLILPEVFINYVAPKYFSGVQTWYIAFSFVLGFAGYDAIKYLERFTLFILKKAGLDVLHQEKKENA